MNGESLPAAKAKTACLKGVVALLASNKASRVGVVVIGSMAKIDIFKQERNKLAGNRIPALEI